MDKEQEKDPDISLMIKFVKTGVSPDDRHLAKKIAAQALQFVVIDETLYFLDAKHGNSRRLVVPRELRDKVMQENHSGVMAGHFSGNRLYNSSHHWWWYTMCQDTLDFSRNCPRCAVTTGSGPIPRPQLHPIPISGGSRI